MVYPPSTLRTCASRPARHSTARVGPLATAPQPTSLVLNESRFSSTASPVTAPRHTQVPRARRRAAPRGGRGGRGGRGARLPRYVPRGGHREERHRRRDLRPKYREGTEERGRTRVSVIANSHRKRLGLGRGGERVEVEGGAQPRAPLPPASSGSAREPVPFRAPAVGAREAPAAGRGGRGGADLGLEGVVFQNLHRQLGADVPRRDAVDAHAVLPAESSSGAARGRSMRGCGGRRALAHSHARFFVSMSMAALVAA